MCCKVWHHLSALHSRHDGVDTSFDGWDYEPFPFSPLPSGAVTLFQTNATFRRVTLVNNSVALPIDFEGDGAGAALAVFSDCIPEDDLLTLEELHQCVSSLWLLDCVFTNNTGAPASTREAPAPAAVSAELVHNATWVRMLSRPIHDVRAAAASTRSTVPRAGVAVARAKSVRSPARLLVQQQPAGVRAAAPPAPAPVSANPPKIVAPVARQGSWQLVFSNTDRPDVFDKSANKTVKPAAPTPAAVAQWRPVLENDAWFVAIVKVRSCYRCVAVAVPRHGACTNDGVAARRTKRRQPSCQRSSSSA
jgi:hypothetical protein